MSSLSTLGVVIDDLLSQGTLPGSSLMNGLVIFQEYVVTLFKGFRRIQGRFDHEIEQLENEYKLRIGKKGYILDNIWEKCEHVHGEQYTRGMLKDLKKTNSKGKVIMVQGDDPRGNGHGKKYPKGKLVCVVLTLFSDSYNKEFGIILAYGYVEKVVADCRNYGVVPLLDYAVVGLTGGCSKLSSRDSISRHEAPVIQSNTQGGKVPF
ncbi:hypothetical protein Tco_1446705 [Tanacetum coccineum]